MCDFKSAPVPDACYLKQGPHCFLPSVLWRFLPGPSIAGSFSEHEQLHHATEI